MKKLLKVIITALFITVIALGVSVIGTLVNRWSPVATLVLEIVIILLAAYHIVDSK